jgi:hypothetical protein
MMKGIIYLTEDRNRRITVYFTDDGRIISYLMAGGLYHTEDGSTYILSMTGALSDGRIISY